MREKLRILGSPGNVISSQFDMLELAVNELYESFRDDLAAKYEALQRKIDECWPRDSYTGKPWPRDSDGKPMELK
jgi:hypothetical protein